MMTAKHLLITCKGELEGYLEELAQNAERRASEEGINKLSASPEDVPMIEARTACRNGQADAYRNVLRHLDGVFESYIRAARDDEKDEKEADGGSEDGQH